MSSVYYNEFDPLKAEVLREAMKAGAIAPGDVDERSIADVWPGDLVGYTQCHFFAGGGFWSLALRHAGWPDGRECWTGSCPCPSFSAAGKGGGFDDPRHLWPHWAELIRECKPAVVFGEQVNEAIGYGWLDLVQTDLEAAAYAVGKIVFGACSVGAPHIRQRLYFCADTAAAGSLSGSHGRVPGTEEVAGARNGQPERSCPACGGTGSSYKYNEDDEMEWVPCDECGNASFCAYTGYGHEPDGRELGRAESPAGGEAWQRLRERGEGIGFWQLQAGRHSATRDTTDADGMQPGDRDLQRGGEQRLFAAHRGVGVEPFGSADAHDAQRRPEGAGGDDGNREATGRHEGDSDAGDGGLPGIGRHAPQRGRAMRGSTPGNTGHASLPDKAGGVREWRGPGWLDPQQARSIAEAGATRGFWADCDWWYGRDAKYRPAGPGLQPLAHGSPARVGRLRLYGDAIVVPQAAEFIEAYCEARGF